MSSVVFALHISQFVYPSLCLLSMFQGSCSCSEKKLCFAAELAYKSCYHVKYCLDTEHVCHYITKGNEIDNLHQTQPNRVTTVSK